MTLQKIASFYVVVQNPADILPPVASGKMRLQHPGWRRLAALKGYVVFALHRFKEQPLKFGN